MSDSLGVASKADVNSKRVWTTLITNTDYLSGLLTLDYSLKQNYSKYPLVALYTDTFPAEGHKALALRGIPSQRIEYMVPTVQKDYSNDPRFYDCWSKMAPFSLTQYDRVVQLDSDMLAVQNMDELIEMNLDGPELEGKGDRVFAASHACVCNPLKKPHYPKDWVPSNCAHTTLHGDPDKAQVDGPRTDAGLSMINGGLQVVNPSAAVFKLISDQLADPAAIEKYEFADQSLLSDLFKDRWVPLPYIYNALKTLRWEGIHDAIWRDDKVKNIHYILSPKPWDEKPGEFNQESHEWWKKYNKERLEHEKNRGIEDGF